MRFSFSRNALKNIKNMFWGHISYLYACFRFFPRKHEFRVIFPFYIKKNHVFSIVADRKHGFSHLFRSDMTNRFFKCIFSKYYDESYFFFISIIIFGFFSFWNSFVKPNNGLKPGDVGVIGGVYRESSEQSLQRLLQRLL